MRVDVYFTDALGSSPTATEKNKQTHAWLCKHLAAQHSTPIICKDTRGKPRLQAPHEKHAISISHSQHAFMLAISADVCWLGLDVESKSRAIQHDVTRLAKRFFHPEEHRSINAMPPKQQSSAFLKLWTMKEALLKGLGHGLSGHINHIQFDWQADYQDWRLEPSTITSNATPHVQRLPHERYWLALAYGNEPNQTASTPSIHVHQPSTTQP